MRFLAMALVLVFPCIAQADNPPSAKPLDAAIDRAIAERKIVGLVVVVAKDGQVVYRRAAGLADRESGRPMELDTVFRLSSVTKPIVASAAMVLVEQGRLNLDDPVTRFLPDFRPKLKDGREPGITVRQLMAHTSGLSYAFLEPPDGPYHRAGVSDGGDLPDFSLDENLRRLAAVPLLHEPGTAWNYSLGVDVLGAVLERAGGAPLSEVVQRTVTGPLGMDDTSFTATAPARLATPYADGPEGPVRMGEAHQLPFGESPLLLAPSRALAASAYPSGGGGMVGTAGDVLTLLEVLRTGGKPILGPEAAALLTTDATGGLPVPLMGPGWGFSLAAAVLIDPKAAGSKQGAGTLAWGGAYGHSWFVDPVARLTVVTLTNTAIAGMLGEVPDSIMAAAYALP
jgi:CubicO group peptidase (beta-lactamase class C family)